MFSGDLLFAGSIGRTDLPGGDYPTILRSLARVCLTLPDETVVLSGHGPQTTIGAERRTNPFLTGLTPASGPSRGCDVAGARSPVRSDKKIAGNEQRHVGDAKLRDERGRAR